MTVDGYEYTDAEDAANAIYPDFRAWADSAMIERTGWPLDTKAAMFTAGLITDEHIEDWLLLSHALVSRHENEAERIDAMYHSDPVMRAAQ